MKRFSVLLLLILIIKLAAAQERPNIIFIITDQQHAGMMSCAGNHWLKTPAMDYIAENGIRFTRAYTTNPVCTPARVSFMTGRFPSAFTDDKEKEVRENVGAAHIPKISDEVKNTTIAAFLKQAGYDLIYGGKEHLPKSLLPETLGFTGISNDERDDLAKAAARFIKSNHNNPYYMVVSFINPHDICYMAIRDFATTDFDSLLLRKGETEISELDKALQKPPGFSEEEFFASWCPPLPPNFEPQTDEPKAINALITQRQFRENARERYSEKDWRMHRYAYCRLTERVDGQIRQVLDALRQSGQENNTLVIFSSDHGDHDGAHRLEHKSTLYEEVTNIPLMAMWKGHIAAGQVDSMSLVSNGLDLLPTVCDYAGIKAVADPRGRSLRPLFEGRRHNWRETLGVESEVGRMVVHRDGYKYMVYDLAGKEVQLLDLNKDPYETTHFTNAPDHRSILKKLAETYDTEWFPGK